MFPVEVDNTAKQLQAIAIQEAMLGDPHRAQVAISMLELYLAGRITVSFDGETGDPTVELIDTPAPVVAFPLFSTPELVERKEPRKIGFQVN